MHNNTYEAILANKTLKADLFFENINSLLPEVFTPLHDVKDLEEPEIRKIVVLYIAIAYSMESPLIIASRDDIKNKKVVASYVGLPDHLHGAVVQLKDVNVRRCVLKYLEEQTDRDWRHLNVKKMQYESLLDKSVLDVNDSDGKVDHKFILQCANSADTLYTSIENISDQLREKYLHLNGAKEEIERINALSEGKKSDGGLNIESAVLSK